MDSTQLTLLVLGLVLAIGVHSSLAKDKGPIQCYQCNSASKYEGADCDDPVVAGKNLKTCPAGYNFCRKIKQDVDGDVRIIRDCAKTVRTDSLRCIDRTGTAKIKIKYCECSGSKCNSATNLKITSTTLGFMAVMSIIVAALRS